MRGSNHKSKSSRTPKMSRSKANAAGFANRRARKSESESVLPGDVYEYTSSKTKRAGVTLSLDKDEAMGMAGEGDEDEDGLRARILNKMAQEGDAIVDSEDDEEIDSDEAFEESDEEQFAGFSFAGKNSKINPKLKEKSKEKSKPNVRFMEVDLDEDESQPNEEEEEEEEDEEGDSDEFLDVLDILDGKGEPHIDVENEERDTDGQDEDEDDEDDGMSDAFAPSEASDTAALDTLGAFVSDLPSTATKRKAEDATQTSPSRKRRMLKERTEAGVESEFGVQAASGSKLRLDDLLAPLASTSSSTLRALKQSVKPLTKGVALAAPLPQRTQDRIDREAAYEQTKAEVDKWKATMKRIKEADHLSFPLQVPQTITVSNSGLTAKFKPSTEMENAVDKLLKAANMRDESDITKTEELKMNHLSVEEVAQRRGELRKMRELMFRAEAKAKRVAKIKSKAYRKIQRKNREKIDNLVKEAEGEGAKEEGQEQMEKEVERARERATLRHKNTGKWAKAMKRRGELDSNQRKEIEEMLDKGERLREKIRGEEVSEDSEDEGDVDEIKAGAFEELKRLEREEEDVIPKEKAKGVFAMKFMQDAMARDVRRVEEAADDFRSELVQMDKSDAEDGEADGPVGVQVQRMGGRMVFRPGQRINIPRPLAPSESSSTLKSSEPALQSPEVAPQMTIRSSPPPSLKDLTAACSPAPEVEAVPNPWLEPQQSVATQSRRKNEVLVGKESTWAEKSKNQLKKNQKKLVEERQKAKHDAVVEISMDEVFTLESSKSNEKGKGKNVPNGKGEEKAITNGSKIDAAVESSDSDSEVETQERLLETKGKVKGIKAFEQRDLVARAFAGDDVVQDFANLKKREIEADAPREEDHTLPGWGTWGGAGVRHNPKAKKVVKKIAGIAPTSRADHGKAHLIISEKKDKKAAKYLMKDLPYPYTSKAQYEKSIEVPIGTEWNTRVGFQRQTLPRIVKKMGTVIDPLEKLF